MACSSDILGEPGNPESPVEDIDNENREPTKDRELSHRKR